MELNILYNIFKAGRIVGPVAANFYELMTAPTTKGHSVFFIALFKNSSLHFLISLSALLILDTILVI